MEDAVNAALDAVLRLEGDGDVSIVVAQKNSAEDRAVSVFRLSLADLREALVTTSVYTLPSEQIALDLVVTSANRAKLRELAESYGVQRLAALNVAISNEWDTKIGE